MAATVTANLTLINACDATTGWSTGAVDTDVKVQNTGCLSIKVSSATSNAVYTLAGATDLSATHIIVWMNSTTPAILDTIANGGLRIRVEDASVNNGEWYVGGKDTYGGGWRAFIIDTTRAFNASSATPANKAAVTKVGITFKTTAMVSGAANNCFWDVLRYGTGLTVTAGTTGDPGTFENILTADTDNANAYGIIRKEGSVYFVQGRLTFGSTTAGVDTIFRDSGQIVVFEDKLVATTLYQLKVQGNATGNTEFSIGTSTGSGDSTLATSTTVITAASASLPYDVLFDDANIDTIKLLGCIFNKHGLVNIGTTSVALAGTTQLVDSTFANGKKLTRNVSGSNHLFVKNTINQNTDTAAALQIADANGGDGDRIRILQSNCFESEDDAVTQTLTVEDHDFTTDGYYVKVYAEKTWNIVDPIWAVVTTNRSKLLFTVNNDNSVNEKFSLSLTVQEPNGTAIASATSYVFEGLLNNNLPTANRQVTSGSGTAASDILTRTFTWDGVSAGLTVVTYGEFALRVYKYVKTPFVGALTVASALTSVITLITDPAITETTAATAITNGSGIVVEKHATGETDPRPLTVMHYDGGAGTVPAIGNTITGAGGATGVVVSVTGTNTEGYIALETRNATAYVNNEAINNGGGGWTASADISGGGSSFYETYTWLVDCNSLNLTVVYDYLAARMAENPITSIFEKAIIWGENQQSQLLYSTSDGFTTERNTSLAQGVWLANYGSGTVSYFTADDGTQFIPPAQYSFELTGLQTGSEVRIYTDPAGVDVNGTESSGASFTHTYTYTGDVSIYVVVFHLDWKDIRLTGLTLSNSNQSIPIQQQTDRVYDNP